MRPRGARIGAPAQLWGALLCIALLLLVTLMAGCGSDPADLVGVWTSAEQGETLQLLYDGTAVLLTKNGLEDSLYWEADSRNLVIGSVGGGDSMTFGYSVRDGVLTLTLPDGESATYTRSDSAGD